MFAHVVRGYVVLLAGLFFGTGWLQAQEEYLRGDANSDGEVTISDAAALFNYFFQGFALPDCRDAQDVNADNEIRAEDPVQVLNYLFGDGPPPAEPFPEPDVEPSVLGCNEYWTKDPLDDPAAKLVVLSAEVENGRLTIVLGASHSAPIAGHSFSLRLPGEILADAEPLGVDLSAASTTGPFDGGRWQEEGSYTHGFLPFVAPPIPESLEVVPIYQLEVCLRAGTIPAGQHPVELVAAEFADSASGLPIKPTLVSGALVLEEGVPGCPAPEPPKECISDGAICPQIEWVKRLGSNVVLRSVRETTDGGYIAAGNAEGDVYLVKTDRVGNVFWESTFGFAGGRDGEVGRCVQQTVDGGYVVAGSTDSSGVWQTDVYFIKTDPEGNLVWERVFVLPWTGSAGYVQQTSDGGYIISAYDYGFVDGTAYLIRTDPEGNAVWERSLGGELATKAFSVQETTDGGFILAGVVQLVAGALDRDTLDIYLAKTDGMGDLIWERTFGGPGQDGSGSVVETADGGYVVLGEADIVTGEGGDVYLAKTDGTGDLLWERRFSGPFDLKNLESQGPRVTTDGGFIIGGDVLRSAKKSHLIKTNSEGQAVWEAIYPYSCRSVQQTTDGGYVFLGDHLVKLAPEPSSKNPFRRGDPNADGTINIADGIGVLEYLFSDGEAPACQDAADTDDSGVIEVTDAVMLFNFLFAGRAAPADPGPTLCGMDPTPDELTCYRLGACR